MNDCQLPDRQPFDFLRERGWNEAQIAAVAADTSAEDDGDPCTDNFRYARCDNRDEVAAYEDAKADGCCGFYDVVLEATDGSKLLYGYNYGH